jgi:hypothetical protein
MPTEYVNTHISFPRPFAVAIDDMGWIMGWSLAERTPSGPYRNGIKRKFDLADYRHVVDIAKGAGVRVQGLFVLSELDRENVLSKYPTTTFQRDKWDNSANITNEQLEIVNYVVSQSANLEFGFHGIGHEHWPESGGQKRAEWYNLEDNHPWPEATLRQHLAAARAILDQYGLSPSRGHSFPETFVPGAYSFYWNPDGDFSLGKLMREAGAKFANTVFMVIPELEPPSEMNGGGFDHGLHVLNRLNYGNLWYELQSLPRAPLTMQPTDVVESHWANWLASDDFLQPEVTAQWISYYRSVTRLPDRYLAKNTAQLHAQWLYKKYTEINSVTEGVITIDNSKMPDEAYQNEIIGNLVLRFVLQQGEHISEVTLNGLGAEVFFEQDGYVYLYLPPLQQSKYTLRYQIGTGYPRFCVFVEGTYNILKVVNAEDKTTVSVKMYGTQDLIFHCDRPIRVSSNNSGLLVRQTAYDEQARRLTVTLEAKDFQGSRGEIDITWEHHPKTT